MIALAGIAIDLAEVHDGLTDAVGKRVEVDAEQRVEPHIDAELLALTELGIRIALDDFGTGYSSLSYLHRFPVDIVKIDKTFIDSLADDKESSPLVGAIVNLGRLLGLSVTAEGVEDSGQLSRLHALGCHSGQGYFFAKPMPAAELTRSVEGSFAPEVTS